METRPFLTFIYHYFYSPSVSLWSRLHLGSKCQSSFIMKVWCWYCSYHPKRAVTKWACPSTMIFFYVNLLQFNPIKSSMCQTGPTFPFLSQICWIMSMQHPTSCPLWLYSNVTEISTILENGHSAAPRENHFSQQSWNATFQQLLCTRWQRAVQPWCAASNSSQTSAKICVREAKQKKKRKKNDSVWVWGGSCARFSFSLITAVQSRSGRTVCFGFNENNVGEKNNDNKKKKTWLSSVL